ncbi:hypothetical protein HPC49_50110 [Pyxidicoccus fallax]|uniref:Lipoprotein n=1 Tax=Pyxidicoccus fallax TaxID=394095 RepID=A0A848L5S3_9BACT|nr:DUF5694 domain-containing protein [Pyxidicoccus fallax]NMO14059.1 hypothetical protein [Pyxidicoccus fallax]NPC86329.1 hypothetical protein [Pyxidicoccus fallax]
MPRLKPLLWMCLMGPLLACASAPAPKPESSESTPDFLGAKEPKPRLMMLGTFHFKDAGLDQYKPQHALDVLSPERQREVEALVEALARFQPTRIAVEVDVPKQAALDARYQDYVAGRAQLTANEVDQVGFRLAKKLGHPKVYAVDADPHQIFNPLFDKVDARQFETADPKWQQRFTQLYAHQDELKTRQPLMEHLRYLNSPELMRQEHGAYSIGIFKEDGEDGYLGADLRSAWYNRNLRIFRNLQRLMSSPDERVLLIIGAGHLPILHFVGGSSPEHEVVDVRDYLRPAFDK